MNFKTKAYEFQFNTRQYILSWLYGRKVESQAIQKPFVPKRTLFVLTGLIGDSIMSFPAITAARTIWPDTHIAVLGKAHNRDLFVNSSDVDEFYVCDADPLSVRKSGDIKKLESWLSRGEFDLAIILLGDQYAHLLAKAKIPVRVGVAGTHMERCLTHTYDIGGAHLWGMNERLNSLRCLGFEIDHADPRLTPQADSTRSATRKLAEAGLKDGSKFAIIHPFGSTTRQWWDLERIPELASYLQTRHDLKLVIVGKRYSLNGVLVEPFFPPSTSDIVNVVDKLTLAELVATIELSRIVITTDSGPFHIAGALQKPIVGLFRSHRPEHAADYRTATVVFGKSEHCNEQCIWDKCMANPCREMQNISLGEIIRSVDLLLQDEG